MMNSRLPYTIWRTASVVCSATRMLVRVVSRMQPITAPT